MESVKAKPEIPVLRSSRSFNLTVIIIVLAVLGISTYTAFRTAQSQVQPPDVTLVSQPVLAEQYGLGVNLVAVTAAGGLLDLRLKIIDGEKAKALLGDQTNFPALLVGDGVVLRAAEDIASQPIKFENDSNLFVIYPNGANIQPGDPVNIVFGDLQVEPILAK